MSIPRMSKKAIYKRADINTDSIGVTYFPYPEPTDKIGYSCNVYGCTAVLRRGCDSGALYAARAYANESGCTNWEMIRSYGNREREIIARLDHIEIEEPGNEGRAVFAFVSRTGERFTVATFDHGRNWTICG